MCIARAPVYSFVYVPTHDRPLYRGLIRPVYRLPNHSFGDFNPPQLLAEQIRGVLLDVDLLFEIHPISHFHEFVRVAGMAILASKLAAAVGVDGPGERHADAGAAVEQGTDGQGEIFHLVSLAEGFTVRGEAGNAHQPGPGIGEE